MTEPTAAFVFNYVTDVVRGIAYDDGRPITEGTELYYDLKLAGEDLADVVDEIGVRFEIDFSSMDVRHYGPSEFGHNFGWNFVRAFKERRGTRTYRSLTVGSLVQAVLVGRSSEGRRAPRI